MLRLYATELWQMTEFRIGPIIEVTYRNEIDETEQEEETAHRPKTIKMLFPTHVLLLRRVAPSESNSLAS